MATSFRPFGCNCHAHSDYSLDGGSSVKKIVKRAKELQYSHIVLTEHGNLNSAAPLAMHSTDEKIQFSHGIEAYLDTPFDKLGLDQSKDNEGNSKRAYSHMTILFKTMKAYEHFCRLTPVMESRAVTRFGERKPIIKWEELEEIGSEIVLGSGCLNSFINRFARIGNFEMAEKAYQMCRSIVQPGCFFLEIFPHQTTHEWKKPVLDEDKKIIEPGRFIENECLGFAGHNDAQKVCNEFMIAMSEKYGDSLIISEDSHFAYPEQKLVQDAKLGNGMEGWKFYSSYHMYTAEDCYNMLNKSLNLSVAQMEHMIDNSYLLKDTLSGYRFLNNKDRWVLPEFNGDTRAHLAGLIKKHGRMNNSPEYMQRLKYEVDVLSRNGKMDFLPYFFEVEDVSSWCKDNGVLMNLRGSGGGCLLAYLLGASITDPIKYNLPFERFITLDRIKANTPPDLDSDFSDKSIVIENRKLKYGDRIVSLSINTNLKLKNSIKDAERALLGSVRKETEAMCFSFPGIPQGPTEEQWLFGYEDKETGEHVDGFWDQSEVLRNYANSNPEIWSMVEECLGVMRNKGSHACGFLITPTSAHNYFPLTWVGTKNDGQLCTAFDPKTLEWSGGIKYDFLGVKTLRTIKIATDLIKERHSVYLEWKEYPHSDEVYEKVFHTGDTFGTFQYGTNVVKPFLKKIKPRSTKDLSAITALCRPGTLEAPAPDGSDRTCAEYYVAVAQGEKPYYIHPDMEPILSETNGVMLYQEQTIYSFVYSGLSLSEAESVRRSIGKKNKDLLQKLIGELKSRLIENKGWNHKQADLLGEQIIASSRYSFNKSHAMSYAIVGYNTAYLKYYYPLEFYTADLTVFSDKDEKLKHYVTALKDKILMPSISHSKPTSWVIEGDKIRAPLSIINGLGAACAPAISENAPYTSVIDFATRCSGRAVNRGVFTKLVLAGLFDEFGTDYDSMIREYWEAKKIKDEFLPVDSMNLSPTERFIKKCQLNLLTKDRLCDIVSDKVIDLGFTKVNNHNIPFLSPQGNALLADVTVATKTLDSAALSNKDFFMLGLFISSGIETTKTGKRLLKVKLTDGATEFEAVNWNQLTSLRIPKNTIILVKGKIKKGWKVPISISFSTIETVS